MIFKNIFSHLTEKTHHREAPGRHHDLGQSPRRQEAAIHRQKGNVQRKSHTGRGNIEEAEVEADHQDDASTQRDGRFVFVRESYYYV